MANTFNNNNSLDINIELPSWVDDIIRQRIVDKFSRQKNKRYSIRILLSEFAATGYYLEHVGSGGTISVHNKEEDVNYSPLDESPEVFLHEGTKVVFPTEIYLDYEYDADGYENRFVPPVFDSDGNEIRSDESNGSTGSFVPPVYDSDGNKIL